MKLRLVDLPVLTRIDSPERRLYRTPEGNEYPSVTTVLSIIPKPELDEWKDRVGHAEAERIAKAAANRGTILHKACEDFIYGKVPVFDMFEMDSQDMFRHARSVLDRIQVVHCIEGQLYSDKLKLAGSVDLVATIEDTIYVLDWKSSSRYKSASEISSYFMQGAAYAAMFYERTGILVKKMKICIISSELGLKEYDEPVGPWLKKFMEIRKEYQKLTGI